MPGLVAENGETREPRGQAVLPTTNGSEIAEALDREFGMTRACADLAGRLAAWSEMSAIPDNLWTAG